jgi:hypothetical protein
LNLVWYPFASLTHGFARNIGFEAGVQRGFFIQASLPASDPQLPNASFGTNVHQYEGGMRYRIPFGAAGNQTWLSVTAGEQAFTFTSTPDCALSTPNTCRPSLDIPDTIYHYLRPAIGLRLELPASFALAANAGFRYILNGGGDQFALFFPHRTVWGADVNVYLGYRVVPNFEIRVGGELRGYAYAMNSTTADAQAVMAGGTTIKVASSAFDRYISGTIGLAFLYGGTRH